jgi:hypothetical protein
MCATSVIFTKISNVNNCPIGVNPPNLVTLYARHPSVDLLGTLVEIGHSLDGIFFKLSGIIEIRVCFLKTFASNTLVVFKTARQK